MGRGHGHSSTRDRDANACYPRRTPRSTPRPAVSPAAPKSRRLHALDALRGIAVFLMIEQHVGIWLWEGPGAGERQLDYPLLVGFNALGGMAAPLFVSLAGVGSAL
ncbi:MAG: DUF1624 domain-containing protein, partial [Myxococcales bacterium]|nr:DUF1624 domain-containing protein [Myxococcales bacterium]